jgi:hypothetical protein
MVELITPENRHMYHNHLDEMAKIGSAANEVYKVDQSQKQNAHIQNARIQNARIQNARIQNAQALRCSLEMALMLIDEISAGYEEYDATKTYVLEALMASHRLTLEVALDDSPPASKS